MKRSEINAVIRRAEEFIASFRFALPPFARWTPEDWADRGRGCYGIPDSRRGGDCED